VPRLEDGVSLRGRATRRCPRGSRAAMTVNEQTWVLSLCVLGAMIAVGVGCGSDPAVVVDGGTTSTTCRTDFSCEDGACMCLSGATSGTTCCDPDVCGASASACDRVCEACVGDPLDAGALSDGGRADSAVAGPDAGSPGPSTCTFPIDACTQDGLDSRDSTSSCASSCGTGLYGCYRLCLANHDSTSYCTSQCGTDTAEAQAGCGEVCAADHDSTSDSYCASQCDP